MHNSQGCIAPEGECGYISEMRAYSCYKIYVALSRGVGTYLKVEVLEAAEYTN